MRDWVIIKVTAIICLTIICVTALLHGIDSVLASSISAIIGGIAGYSIGRRRVMRRYHADNRDDGDRN